MTLFSVPFIFLMLFSFICLTFFARDITKGTVISVYLNDNNDNVGRDNSVGIATRYELDGPGFESRCGARFSTPVKTGPGAHPASYTMGTGSFPGVQRPGRDVDRPPHLAPMLKKEWSSTSTTPLSLRGLF